ncbi:MAG: D-lactate dehydrogenase [Pseudomonadota bacterium]
MQSDLRQAAKRIVGRRNVLSSERATSRFRTGYRTGKNPAKLVLLPGTLRELWDVLNLCVEHDLAIIMQAANTSLTGGSTPNGNYDRAVVIINTRRIDKLHYLPKQRQVIAQAGATLFALEELLKPIGREPHSVIGSSCIGASVVGGVCNNSGGALVNRGPAYTDYAVFARINSDRSIELVNALGVELGDTPEEMLTALDTSRLEGANVVCNSADASDKAYKSWVRDTAATSAARFNADPRRLSGASGCAGKIVVFAVRLDTFEKPRRETTFFIKASDPDALTTLRRTFLESDLPLPVSAEYLHADLLRVSSIYGRDTIYLIKWLGTKCLPSFFALKGSFDSWVERFSILPQQLSDYLLQLLSKVLPQPIPKRFRAFAPTHPHILLLKVADDAIDGTKGLLKELSVDVDIRSTECSADEAQQVFLLRFAAAGAALRQLSVHPNLFEDVIALDVALPRCATTWFENPADNPVFEHLVPLLYGHFFCHVFHQDYLVKKGQDVALIKQALLSDLDRRGAKYPAEHNVGHHYEADAALQSFYRGLDPTNTLNPGIGKMSKRRSYE